MIPFQTRWTGVRGRAVIALLMLSFGSSHLLAHTPPAPTPAPAGGPVVSIPARPSGAPTGSAFLAQTKGLTRAQREDAILAQLAAGNVPAFLREWRKVTVVAAGADGKSRTCTYRVLPDYLAIGTDADFVRIPMGSRTAQKVADLFGASLPTRRMVDQVWKASEVKLSPIPLPPGAIMTTNYYYGLHHTKVEAKRKVFPLGVLTAGHKKDVVISNRLLWYPARVAIYGWHFTTGKPIQPLSTVHEHSYADYSHGIRLIDATVTVDGVDMPLVDVLKSPVMHKLLSDEGVMPSPRVPGVPKP